MNHELLSIRLSLVFSDKPIGGGWNKLKPMKTLFFWEKTRLILIHNTCKLDFSWFSESIVSFVLVMWKPNSGTYFGHIAIACFR